MPGHPHDDYGCEGISSCCLACPLIRCRFDDPDGIRGVRNAERYPQVQAYKYSGLPVDDIAVVFDLSPSSVRRIWKLAPNGTGQAVAVYGKLAIATSANGRD